MTQHETLDDVSMEAVKALAEALQVGLCEGAKTAVEQVLDPIRDGLQETNRQLLERAGEMAQSLEDAEDHLRRDNQTALLAFLHDEALPTFTREVDQKLTLLPAHKVSVDALNGMETLKKECRENVNTILARVGEATEVLPDLQKGVIDIAGNLGALSAQGQENMNTILARVGEATEVLPDLQKGIIDIAGNLGALSAQGQENVNTILNQFRFVSDQFSNLQSGLGGRLDKLEKKSISSLRLLFLLSGLVIVLQAVILWVLIHR